MKTTQTTKPANKPANKPATKAAQSTAKAETKAADTTATKAAETKAETPAKPEVKTPYFAALHAACLAGKLGDAVKAYYKRADQYHGKQGTTFPRARNMGTIAAMVSEGREKLETKAKEIIGQCQKGILAPGNMEGQALYDMMRAGQDLPQA